MTEPTCPNLRDILHQANSLGGFSDFFDDMRIGAIEHSRVNFLSALDDDAENCCRYQKTDGRVGQWVAKPHAYGPDQHRQACPPIDPRMVPIGDQCRAVDLAPDANSQDCNGFVADESDYRSTDDRRQVRNRLRI